jgi:hypothetical protein
VWKLKGIPFVERAQHWPTSGIEERCFGAHPDILELSHLRMKVIERGGKLAVRLMDLKNPPACVSQPATL